MNRRSAEWRLVRRPSGTPDPSDVELVEVELDQPGPGEVLVRNTVMSVEPYMWGRMTGSADYAAPYQLGAAITGHAVGRVVESAAPAVPEGTVVLHEAGWREAAVLPAAQVRCLDHPDHPDHPGLPASAWLAAMGLTGLTAYVGLLDIARCRPGDTVFVSAAAGAVGSTAAQMA